MDLTSLKLQTCQDSVFSYYRQKLQNLNSGTEKNKEIQSTLQYYIKLGLLDNKTDDYSTEKDLIDPSNTEIITTVSGKDAAGRNTPVEVAIPLLNEYQPWLELVKPVVFIGKDDYLYQNFKSIQPGDRLYVWAILNAAGTPWHLAATVVLQNGDHLSFGMGYMGSMPKSDLPSERSWYEMLTQMSIPGAHSAPQKAGLYTPDYLYISAVLRQLTKPSGEFLKLIAATEMTQEFVNYLNEEFDKLDYDDVQIEMDFFQFNTGMQVFTSQKSRANMTSLQNFIAEDIRQHQIEFAIFPYMDDLSRQITLLESYSQALQKGIVPVGYLYNLVEIKDRTYCKISGKGPERGANCTSYLQKLFKGLLNCSLYDIMFLGQSDKFLVDPKLCRQAAEVDVPICVERKYLTAGRAAPVSGRPSAMVVSEKERFKRASNEEDARLMSKVEKLAFKFSDKDVDSYWANLPKNEKIKMILKHKKGIKKNLREREKNERK
jgi:hypothetical protein